MFNGYYELPSYNCKNQYLAQLITKKETKNQRLYGSENKSRVSHIFTYHVIVDGNKIKVCKTAFLNIFDIGKEKAEVVVKKTILMALLNLTNVGNMNIIIKFLQ